MSETWPIGPGRATLAFRTDDEGEVCANDLVVTHHNGWLDVRVLSTALALGAPPIVSVQLAVRAAGVEVGEVVVSGRRYPSARAVDAPWAEFWRATLAEAVHAELTRRVAHNKPTVRLRAVRPATGPI